MFGAIELTGIDLALMWGFKPRNMVVLVVACAGAAVGLIFWLKRQFDDREQRKGRRRFLVPFAIGFMLPVIATVCAPESDPGANVQSGWEDMTRLIVALVELVVSGCIGTSFYVWARTLVHYVRLAERSKARDGEQLVRSSVCGGLLGVSSVLSGIHWVALGAEWRLPDLIGHIVVWCICTLVWLGALLGLLLIARARAAERHWLASVKGGEVDDYAIVPLAEHPEWAELPPYLTAGSYSGVLVYEPEDEGEESEVWGRVQ